MWEDWLSKQTLIYKKTLHVLTIRANMTIIKTIFNKMYALSFFKYPKHVNRSIFAPLTIIRSIEVQLT